MVRILASIALVLLLIQFGPSAVSASGDQEMCLLDGYLSVSVSNHSPVVVPDAEAVLPLSFSVSNDSSTYTYGSVEIGVGLYENETATTPVYWTAAGDGVEFFPGTTQNFYLEIDASHVPAGEYVARVGVGQGSQLTAFARGVYSPAVLIKKDSEAVSVYPTSVTAISVPDRVGGIAEFSLTTLNDSSEVRRDYEQHLVIGRGETPLGSAVLSDLSEMVKMIPGSEEVTSGSALITSEGEYSVIGFSAADNLLLPVSVNEFTIGEEAGPRDGHVVAVGVSGLDTASKTFSVVSCLGSVTAEPIDVMQLEQKITSGGSVIKSTVADVSQQGMVKTVVDKTDMETFVITTNLYSYSNQSAGSINNSEIGSVLGLLEQTITQNFECNDECVPDTVGETLESFVAEDVVQDTIWFYLGIIAASVLLMILMIGRLGPSKEKQEPMHIPE